MMCSLPAKSSRPALWLTLLILVSLFTGSRLLFAEPTSASPDDQAPKVETTSDNLRPLLRQDLGELVIEQTKDGPTVKLQMRDGWKTIPASELPGLIAAEQQRLEGTWAGWWINVLNISSWWQLPWIMLGFGAQAVFMGRMVVQWLVSEKNRKSVVPPAFWWMSLVGSSMLLIYFLWRKDAVSMLAQSVGWSIYLRNLWLIYFGPKAEVAPVQIQSEKA